MRYSMLWFQSFILACGLNAKLVQRRIFNRSFLFSGACVIGIFLGSCSSVQSLPPSFTNSDSVKLVQKINLKCRGPSVPRSSMVTENGKYVLVNAKCGDSKGVHQVHIFDLNRGKLIYSWSVQRDDRFLGYGPDFLRAGSDVYIASIQAKSAGLNVPDDSICVEKFKSNIGEVEHLGCFGSEYLSGVYNYSYNKINNTILFHDLYSEGGRLSDRFWKIDLSSSESERLTRLSLEGDFDRAGELANYRIKTIDFSDEGLVQIFWGTHAPASSMKSTWSAAEFFIADNRMILNRTLGGGADVSCQGWLGQQKILATPWQSAHPPEACILTIEVSDAEGKIDTIISKLFSSGFKAQDAKFVERGWEFVEASRSETAVVLHSYIAARRIEYHSFFERSASILINCEDLEPRVCGDVFALNAKEEFAQVVGGWYFRYRVKLNAQEAEN